MPGRGQSNDGRDAQDLLFRINDVDGPSHEEDQGLLGEGRPSPSAFRKSGSHSSSNSSFFSSNRFLVILAAIAIASVVYYFSFHELSDKSSTSTPVSSKSGGGTTSTLTFKDDVVPAGMTKEQHYLHKVLAAQQETNTLLQDIQDRRAKDRVSFVDSQNRLISWLNAWKTEGKRKEIRAESASAAAAAASAAAAAAKSAKAGDSKITPEEIEAALQRELQLIEAEQKEKLAVLDTDSVDFEKELSSAAIPTPITTPTTTTTVTPAERPLAALGIRDTASTPATTTSSHSAHSVSPTADAASEYRRASFYKEYLRESREMGTTFYHFDKYDQPKFNFMDSPPEKVEAKAGEEAIKYGTWWDPKDPQYAFGQFPFDVSRRRFLASPAAYAAYNTKLDYNPAAFREIGRPIIWGDQWGHVHWNQEAERQFYHLMREQQHPYPDSAGLSGQELDCSKRKFVVINQWVQGGFFSRYREAVQLQMRALMAGREIILLQDPMSIKDTNRDDWLGEGIDRYFMPFSQCSYSEWFLELSKNEGARASWPKWNSVDQAHDFSESNRAFQNAQIWHLPNEMYWENSWKPPRYHLPHRKHMFAYGPGVKYPMRYASYENMLSDRFDHPAEHVYPHPTSTFERKAYWGQYEENAHPADRLVIKFYWYMILLWQYAPIPRINSATTMLKQHWSSEFTDRKYKLSQNIAHTKALYPDAIKHSAAMMVRRGDKGVEDSFYMSHGHFRDISLYGYTLQKRANDLGKPWNSLFFMTEERELLAEIQACANTNPRPELPDGWQNHGPVNSNHGQPMRPSGCRSVLAENQFAGTPLAWNVYAPQACYDPFLRIGFEQFLVSLNYIIQHSTFAVGHLNSNIGRILEEMMYATRQLDPSIESAHTVYEDAVDDYHGRNTTGT